MIPPAQEAFYLGMIDRLNRQQPRPAAQQLSIRDQEARLRECLIYLQWFTGQKATDKRDCHSKIDLIEEDVDKWLAYFSNFQKSCQVAPALHRRAFFARLSGKAFRHLYPYYNNMDIDLVQLSAMLRVRFLPTRTLDKVLQAKRDFTHSENEKLASYVERYNELLVKQMELDRHFSEEARVYQLWSKFWSILGQDCRERMELADLDDPLKLSPALLRAQEYYISRGESPWPRKRPRDSRAKAEVNAVKASDKCNACGDLGHWARDCVKVGDLRSYDSKPSGAPKAPMASAPAGSCQYCARDHSSTDCFHAKSLMRQAGFVTSGRGGAASSGKKRNPEPKKGSGESSKSTRGKNSRARGRGRGRRSASRGDQVHTVDVEPEGVAAVLPAHPCSLSEEDSDGEGGPSGLPPNFQ